MTINQVVACNSFVKHSSQSIFNERVAAYEIGMLLLRKRFPEFANRLEHLRDINPRHLRVPLAQIYQMIKALPERMSRKEIRLFLPDQRDELDRLFLMHDEPEDGYRVRGVCLYGIAECARSAQYKELLLRGEMTEFGKLKCISHDGDRVFSFQSDGSAAPWGEPVSDQEIDRLIADVTSADEVRVQAAQLSYQPGSYRCSCQELDLLVDLARGVDGVVGAGLSGGGLGGCVLAVVRAGAVDELIETVKRGYYDPKGLPLGTIVCSSVKGAGAF